MQNLVQPKAGQNFALRTFGALRDVFRGGYKHYVLPATAVTLTALQLPPGFDGAGTRRFLCCSYFAVRAPRLGGVSGAQLLRVFGGAQELVAFDRGDDANGAFVARLSALDAA